MELKNSSQPLKHFSSRSDYLASKKGAVSHLANSANSANVDAKKLGDIGDSATTEISEVSKATKEASREVSKNLSGANGKDGLLTEATKMVGTEALKAGLSQMKPAVEMAKNIAKGRKERATSEAQAVKVKKVALRKDPLVIFFTGFEMFSSDSDAGLKKLAEHIPGAKVMSWTDEDEALEEIKRYRSDVPIILGGHSLGSDTAVNVAQALNTLDHGFRQVDLLVTLDSIGSDNDVIPSNTKKNLNFIGEKQGFFNDGPNIARNLEVTEVVNELRPEDHLEIDNENSVMKKIFQEITPIIENHNA